MPASLNLQRNSEVYVSTIDLSGTGLPAHMTPVNTWRVEVLAGYAASQAASTQDITSLESGTAPDRSVQRFNTAISPTEWSFSTYVRPTGITTINGATSCPFTGNVTPLADWFLWQTLVSNTPFASGAGASSKLQSVWQADGKCNIAERVAAANVAPHKSNFATATEIQLYVKMDNIMYQIKNATVNEASVDAAVDGIATTNWTGFGTNLIELTGPARDNLVSVVGGTLNAGTTATGNSNASASAAAVQGYHRWASYNVNGTITTSGFIKNRLSSISITHTPQGASANTYTFPVTGLGLTYNNGISYLTPEELASLNSPIGQFTGSRTITGNFTAYLRTGNNDSAQFLRNIVADSRTSIAQAATANLQIGGTTAPFFAAFMPAVQFNFPTHSIDDVIGISVEFLAQEPTSTKGAGGELVLVTSTVS